MKSLLFLWRELASELGDQCGVSTIRDFKTVSDRFEHEGLSFMTITLPDFAKDFQKSLAQGQVDHDSFLSFRKDRGGLPLFLGGFLGLVFDRCAGRILDEPCVDAIFAVRQLTLVFSKIEIPCSDARNARAIQKFIECEKEVKRNDMEYSRAEREGRCGHCSLTAPEAIGSRRSDLREFGRSGVVSSPNRLPSIPEVPTRVLPHAVADGRGDHSSCLRCLRASFKAHAARAFGSVFGHLQNSLSGEIRDRLPVPKHGPGATADRLRGNYKFLQDEWPLRLEELFPYREYALPSPLHWRSGDHVRYLEPGQERPTRVILVPKTLKTPRIIATEPTAMQYIQQSLAEILVSTIEHDSLVGPLIGFTDQAPNQHLAREGSLTGELATLDLSEASDRVSNQHVHDLLANAGLFAEAVQACRSRKADVPGHGVIRLSKFASMGSALTFPIEAMVFLTVVLVGISEALMRPLTVKDIKSLHGKVRVYGDDIIVPVEYTSSVISALHAFGHVVNTDKSFWTGQFRESCGKDYFDGHDVSIMKFRRMPPSGLTDVSEVVSLVSFRNRLYKAGLWKTCQFVDRMVEGVLPHFPIVDETSVVVGRTSFLPYQAEEMCRDLHVPLVKGYTVSVTTYRDPIDGPPAALKWYLRRGFEPLPKNHWERSGRAKSLRMKLGWRTPY